jgi:hypothetical protein
MQGPRFELWSFVEGYPVPGVQLSTSNDNRRESPRSVGQIDRSSFLPPSRAWVNSGKYS